MAMRRPKVLLTGAMHPDGERAIAAVAEVVRAPDAQPGTLRRLVAGADVLVVRSPLPADLFDHAPLLRGLVRHCVGVDMIPVEAASARGIPVANVPGANREAVYTNLPPQQYRFVVEATNGDGVWTQGATWNFGVEPMFYQTRWFAALMTVMAGLLVAAVWRIRVRSVRRQFALVLAERIRMSRAIHDTLLQGLAGLALQVDDLSHTLEDADRQSARRRVVKMRRMVEEYIREARQSIWDLRSPRLAQSDLPNALKQAGERAIGERPVTLDFTITGTPHRCAPFVEEQLLLIGQEAVNNAVQHGRATRVGMEIFYDESHTRLRVSDDGCGFDPASLAEANGHYGLISMRERAEQVKGRVRIDSSPGRGTLVEAVVPTV